MLLSATEHYQRQQRIGAAGLIEARNARRRGSAAVARVVTAYQIVAAKDAARSVPLMLEEQGLPDEPVGEVAVARLAGTASDGRPLETLFDQAESDYKFGLMVATQLQDVARIAAGLGIVARPRVTGYVRMLNPPSCARCAILAGKFFKWNKGFDRHPQCDCRHIPSSEALAGDLTTDPRAYFDSLSPADQAKTFGKHNAEAIREGADVGQVVNAYKGTSTTATRVRVKGRGQEGSGTGVVLPGHPDLMAGITGAQESIGRVPVGRLTPEGIYTSTSSRTEAIGLLRELGYIL